MSTPARRPNRHPAKPPGKCPYCGAPLNPAFYFCLACASPYQTEEILLTPLRPMRMTDGMKIAARAPVVAPLFWTYLGVIVGAGMVGELLIAEDRPDLRMLLGDGAIVLVTCIFGVLHWRALKPQFSRIGFGHPAAWLGLLALIPLLTLNYYYHSWVMYEVGGPPDTLLEQLRENGFGRAGLIFAISLLPGVTEEIAFRGLVQHWLERAIRPRNAIILASALFTALHFSVVSAPYLFGVGLLLGIVKWKTQSLYPCMLIHALHNLLVIEVLWG